MCSSRKKKLNHKQNPQQNEKQTKNQQKHQPTTQDLRNFKSLPSKAYSAAPLKTSINSNKNYLILMLY